MKKYIIKNKKYIIMLVISCILSALFDSAMQFFRGFLLQSAIKGDLKSCFIYGSGFLLFAVLGVIFLYLLIIYGYKFSTLCTRDLRYDLFSSIMSMNYKEFSSLEKGEYVSKITNEVSKVEEDFFNNLNLLIEVSIKAVVIVASLLYLDITLSMIATFSMLLPIFIPRLIQNRVEKSSDEYRKKLNMMTTILTEYFSGFEMIRNYSLKNIFIKKFAEFNNTNREYEYLSRKSKTEATVLSIVMSFISFAIALIFSVYLVSIKRFDAGVFFTAMGLIDTLSWPIVAISRDIQGIVSSKPFVKSLIEFIDEKKLEKVSLEPKRNIEIDGENKALDIEYRNVSFGYDDRRIIDNFSFNFEGNKKYLIKGESGCGKTTLVNLLLGYNEDYEGKICINGVNIRDINDLYKHTCVVRQEAFLLNDTVINNICLYDEIDEKEVVKVLKLVNLDRFATEEGMNLIIENDGNNISGGEKKRMCLARALIRKNKILILDEPLSNLDKENVECIENIIKNIEDRTLIVISHVYSNKNISDFDKVIELKKFDVSILHNDNTLELDNKLHNMEIYKTNDMENNDYFSYNYINTKKN